MRAISSILVVCICFELSGQRVTSHTWDHPNITFETAKMKVMDSKSKQYINDQFKTSTIRLYNADLGIKPDITIDIPDKYYGTGFSLIKTTYEITIGETEYVSYILESQDEKDMIGLSIFYVPGEDLPDRILVSIIENYKGKVTKNHAYVLYQLKK